MDEGGAREQDGNPSLAGVRTAFRPQTKQIEQHSNILVSSRATPGGGIHFLKRCKSWLAGRAAASAYRDPAIFVQSSGSTG